MYGLKHVPEPDRDDIAEVMVQACAHVAGMVGAETDVGSVESKYQK